MMTEKDFIKREPILKGWSDDRKFRGITEDGKSYLLRISSADQYEKKKLEFEMMKQLEALKIPMCLPVAFGVCEEGVYSIQSWIDGEDAEQRIPELSRNKQYSYGLQSGRILQKIHSVPAPATQEEWESRFNRKIDRKILNYSNCPIQFDGSQQMIDYIESNRHLLSGRPQCYQHGDYHIGNMLLRQDELMIIDFNRYDFGDPWEEFNRIVWCAQVSPEFARGMVDGYFQQEPPEPFWRLLALYIASNTLSSIYWALPFGKSEVEKMLNQAQDVLNWYSDMKCVIPEWYRRG